MEIRVRRITPDEIVRFDCSLSIARAERKYWNSEISRSKKERGNKRSEWVEISRGDPGIIDISKASISISAVNNRHACSHSKFSQEERREISWIADGTREQDTRITKRGTMRSDNSRVLLCRLKLREMSYKRQEAELPLHGRHKQKVSFRLETIYSPDVWCSRQQRQCGGVPHGSCGIVKRWGHRLHRRDCTSPRGHRRTPRSDYRAR